MFADPCPIPPPAPPPVWNTLGLKEVLTQLPFSSLEPEGAEQTLFAMLELVWELPEGLVSVLPNLQLSGEKWHSHLGLGKIAQSSGHSS